MSFMFPVVYLLPNRFFRSSLLLPLTQVEMRKALRVD